MEPTDPTLIAYRIKQLHEIIDQRDQTIREMADDIRSMDQLIYQLSQCWGMTETSASIFRGLLNKTEARMRRESDRITDIMRKELLEVYTNPDHNLVPRLKELRIEDKSK